MLQDEWKSIIQFCDSENHVFTESRHNNLCQGKSAWEIMRSHADFALNSSEPASGLIINVEHLRREYIVLLVEYTADMVNVDHKWSTCTTVFQYLLHDLAWVPSWRINVLEVKIDTQVNILRLGNIQNKCFIYHRFHFMVRSPLTLISSLKETSAGAKSLSLRCG
nr:uncharacterized protein LOC113804071 [Penaeus vannamei]